MEYKKLGDNESMQILKDAALKKLTYKAMRNKFYNQGYRNKNGALTVPNVVYFNLKNKKTKQQKEKIEPPKQTISIDVLLKNVMESNLNSDLKLSIIKQLMKE